MVRQAAVGILFTIVLYIFAGNHNVIPPASATAAALSVSPSRPPKVLYVTATAYTPSPDETSGDPWLTASGRRLTPGRTVAVSRDLIRRPHIQFGTKIRILGYRHIAKCTFVVEDLTANHIRNTLDIALHSKKYAYLWGRRKVKIEILPPNAPLPLCNIKMLEKLIIEL